MCGVAGVSGDHPDTLVADGGEVGGGVVGCRIGSIVVAEAVAAAAPASLRLEVRADLAQRHAGAGQERDPGDAGQVGHVVLAIPAGRARGLGHDAQAVVMPDAARADPDDPGDLADSHALIMNLDTVTRSRACTGARECLARGEWLANSAI